MGPSDTSVTYDTPRTDRDTTLSKQRGGSRHTPLAKPPIYLIAASTTATSTTTTTTALKTEDLHHRVADQRAGWLEEKKTKQGIDCVWHCGVQP